MGGIQTQIQHRRKRKRKRDDTRTFTSHQTQDWDLRDEII